MVSRMRLNVTLHVHCVAYYNWEGAFFLRGPNWNFKHNTGYSLCYRQMYIRNDRKSSIPASYSSSTGFKHGKATFTLYLQSFHTNAHYLPQTYQTSRCPNHEDCGTIAEESRSQQPTHKQIQSVCPAPQHMAVMSSGENEGEESRHKNTGFLSAACPW
jgi:hypothetical protein